MYIALFPKNNMRLIKLKKYLRDKMIGILESIAKKTVNGHIENPIYFTPYRQIHNSKIDIDLIQILVPAIWGQLPAVYPLKCPMHSIRLLSPIQNIFQSRPQLPGTGFGNPFSFPYSQKVTFWKEGRLSVLLSHNKAFHAPSYCDDNRSAILQKVKGYALGGQNT